MSLDETPPLGSNEWLENFRKRHKKLQGRLKSLNKSLINLTRRFQEIHADILIKDIEADEGLRKKFIDKLYDPFHEPTEVERIVIQRLLKQENEED